MKLDPTFKIALYASLPPTYYSKEFAIIGWLYCLFWYVPKTRLQAINIMIDHF